MFFKVKGTRLFLCGCLFLSSHSFSYAQEWESDFPLSTTLVSSNSKTATSSQSQAHTSASEEFVREQQALEQKHADERSDILWQPHTLSDVRRNRIIANHNSLEQRLAQKMELEDYLSSLDEVNLTTGAVTGDALPTAPKQAPLDKGDSNLTALAHSSPNVESSQLYPTATSTNSNQNNTVLEASTKAQPNPHSKAQALNSSGSNQGSHSAPVPNKGYVINPSQSIGKSTSPRANHSPSYSSSPSVSMSMSTNNGAIYHSSTLSSALQADRASSLESTTDGKGLGNSNAGGIG